MEETYPKELNPKYPVKLILTLDAYNTLNDKISDILGLPMDGTNRYLRENPTPIDKYDGVDMYEAIVGTDVQRCADNNNVKLF